MPELPDDITDLSDGQLMQMFTQFTGWCNYAAAEFSKAEVAEAQAEAFLKFQESVFMVGNAKETDKVTWKRAEAIVAPNVEAARSSYMQAYAYRKMAAVVSSNCERCASLISRELSRRIGREPVERRSARWNP